MCNDFINVEFRSKIEKLFNHLEISTLSQSLPGFLSFSTTGRDIYRDENFTKLVRSIVFHFEQLVELTFNKDSSQLYHIREDPKMLMK